MPITRTRNFTFSLPTRDLRVISMRDLRVILFLYQASDRCEKRSRGNTALTAIKLTTRLPLNSYAIRCEG